MPRAFLITHRRYPGKGEEGEEEEGSPQPGLECPDELYNLTQLAEVSLAAAAGHIFPSKARDQFTCTECGKAYTTSSNLARHRQVHRSLCDKKARRCPQCGKLYVSIPAFSMHIRTHSQTCRCHICGKAFSRPWLLQGHIRTHTGEKPFKCSVCGKAFADKSNLRAHVQTHSNAKPHVCSKCGKAFALKSYLYKHEESSCLKTSPTSTVLRAEIDGKSQDNSKDYSCSTEYESADEPTAISLVIPHRSAFLTKMPQPLVAIPFEYSQ